MFRRRLCAATAAPAVSQPTSELHMMLPEPRARLYALRALGETRAGGAVVPDFIIHQVIMPWGLVNRTSKLAVAVAIIKSKPAGTSGRQHAENLAAKLRQQEDAWKAKAQDLKEEVLRLRQELFLTKLLSDPRRAAEGGCGDVVKLLSQDFTDPKLSENDSGCETSNNTQTLPPTPDLVDTQVPCHSSTAPTSPARPRSVTFPYQRGSLKHSLSKRTQFLQHLSGLRRSAGSALVVDGDGAVVWDSVLHLLSSVIEAFKEASGTRVLPQPALLLQASQVAAQALEHQRPPALCLGQVEDLLKELLNLLLSNSQLNKSLETHCKSPQQRPSRPSQQPISIKGVDVEVVRSYRYLGVHLDERLDWSVNTDIVYKKAQSRLYFLRRLGSFGICQKLLLMFYQSVVASVLFYAVVCWGGSISKRDAGRLDRLVRKGGSVLGLELESLTPLAERRALNKLLNIMDNVHHPLHTTIIRQRSSFSGRLLSQSCSTDRLRKSFGPQAIRLFNSSHSVEAKQVPEGALCFFTCHLAKRATQMKFETQETLTECLVSLGSSSVLRSVLVRLLLSQINHLAQHLWNACQSSSPEQQHQVDWSRYENSVYLFWLLEKLPPMAHGRAGTEHRDLQAQLESYILPLSDEFPLFALYMWRIRALSSPTVSAGT
ncbi:hypothetical protein NFI96_014632 [Prochilodus magdalenae]|nr:hypothetical protein NFI96_014632 [Prochilodus magdalenae]